MINAPTIEITTFHNVGLKFIKILHFQPIKTIPSNLTPRKIFPTPNINF